MDAFTGESGAERAFIKYYVDVGGFNPVTGRPLEAFWFEKLQKARKALSVASANVKALKSEYLTLPPSNGHYAYRQALATETQAQTEYNRVLRVSDIVLNGSLPDENLMVTFFPRDPDQAQGRRCTLQGVVITPATANVTDKIDSELARPHPETSFVRIRCLYARNVNSPACVMDSCVLTRPLSS